MRDFAAAAGRLRALSIGAKLLYSAFTLSAVLGLVVSWRLYGSMVGEAGAASYYAGAALAVPEQPAQPGVGGPVLELPDDVAKPRVLVEQISDRKLLEVTHFHLFSVPVYVLILAHLWLLARMPAWLHSAGVVASVLVSALHLAAPWLVRGHAELASLVPVSGVGMLVVLGVVAAVPTVDMWLPRTVRRGDPDEIST